MVAGESSGLPPRVVATGWKPGKRKGWTALTKGQYVAYQQDGSRELSIAMVLHNDVSQKLIVAHSCRTLWTGTAVEHRKEYWLETPEGRDVVLDPTDEVVKVSVQYDALVRTVELLHSHRLMHGDASALSKGGWSYKIMREDQIRAIACAAVLEDELLSRPAVDAREGMTLTLSLIHISEPTRPY